MNLQFHLIEIIGFKGFYSEKVGGELNQDGGRFVACMLKNHCILTKNGQVEFIRAFCDKAQCLNY